MTTIKIAAKSLKFAQDIAKTQNKTTQNQIIISSGKLLQKINNQN